MLCCVRLAAESAEATAECVALAGGTEEVHRPSSPRFHRALATAPLHRRENARERESGREEEMGEEEERAERVRTRLRERGALSMSSRSTGCIRERERRGEEGGREGERDGEMRQTEWGEGVEEERGGSEWVGRAHAHWA